MATLPVREMVLYKHGVGFFVREGRLSGGSVALTFRQEEINDVLKSLAVFDRAGGQVMGIHYQTPMDKTARLASSSIRLSEDTSLRDLLGDLRGRRAALTFETTPGTLETVVGRVIGIDAPGAKPDRLTYGDDVLNEVLVSVLADDGQVRAFRFGMLRALRIEDTQSEHDLRYFLDTSMGEDARRTVNVRLSEGEHELVAYYVAPSPTWRVSYRLVAESGETQESGRALLQGWGLFDNRLEEDLDNVRVTLVAGQPISFIYELYASRIPQRPTVEDESRVAPGPVQYSAAAKPSPAQARTGGSLLQRVERPAVFAAQAQGQPDLKSRIQQKLLSELDTQRLGVADRAQMRQHIEALFNMILAEENVVLSRAERQRLFDSMTAEILSLPNESYLEMAGAQQTAAEGKEKGEFFQYVVTAPVSVKRGDSALVPIIGAEIRYERELLYHGAKLPNHPVAALRFTNATGLTLERGPVTVVENGSYNGEAVIPFTKEGHEVYLPYAVELGVRVVERIEWQTITAGLSIERAYLVYEEYQVETVKYVIENTTSRPLTLTIEAPIRIAYELFETRPADVETVSERRWRVSLNVQGKTEFVRKERQRTHRYEGLRTLTHQKVHDFLKNRWLDDMVFQQLSEMLDQMDSIQQAQTKQAELEQERVSIYQRQEQLRANLNTLQPTGQEAALRNRMLGQLENTQNRLDEIDQQMNDLNRQIAEAEARVNEIIAGLGSP